VKKEKKEEEARATNLDEELLDRREVMELWDLKSCSKHGKESSNQITA